MKPEVLKHIDLTGLAHFNLDDDSRLLGHSKIDCGFVANDKLKGLTERERLSVRLDFKQFVVAMVKKIQDKSPLNYKLVRNLEWLLPKTVLMNEG